MTMRKELKFISETETKTVSEEINCRMKSEQVSKKFTDKKTETGCVREYSSRANSLAKRAVKKAFITELNLE